MPALHDDSAESIDAWSRSQALEALVTAFGGERHEGRELDEWLGYLETFSERWDFRNGRERNLVATHEIEPGMAHTVRTAAEHLGLSGRSRPARTDYRMLVVLGGLVRSCFARPLYAAELLTGSVTVERVVALGGHRPLSGDEVLLLAEFNDEGIGDEHGAMCAGVMNAFGTSTSEAQRTATDRSMMVDYTAADGTPIHVISVPARESGRRANTADTYAWLASRRDWLGPDDTVLIVTTDIYVPYQRADAIRMLTLPLGVGVDIVGVVPGETDSRLCERFEPHQYLQEIRSTIRAFRQLQATMRPATGRHTQDLA